MTEVQKIYSIRPATWLNNSYNFLLLSTSSDIWTVGTVEEKKGPYSY